VTTAHSRPRSSWSHHSSIDAAIDDQGNHIEFHAMGHHDDDMKDNEDDDVDTDTQHTTVQTPNHRHGNANQRHASSTKKKKKHRKSVNAEGDEDTNDTEHSVNELFLVFFQEQCESSPADQQREIQSLLSNHDNVAQLLHALTKTSMLRVKYVQLSNRLYKALEV